MGGTAVATDECGPKDVAGKVARHLGGVSWDDEATRIWLEHEVEVNATRFPNKKKGFEPFPANRVQKRDVEMPWVEDVDPKFRAAVESTLFASESEIFWPHNPDNLDPRVPYFSAVKEPWIEAHRTGSRSAVALKGGIGFKAPDGRTDLDGKYWVGTDIQESLEITRWAGKVERRIGPKPNVVLLKDVGAIVDPKTKNGVLFRDLRPITTGVPQGHFWVPGFSILRKYPHLAQQYERLVAEANATMMIRYGCVSTSPHDQQFVVLIRDGSPPTLEGQIAVRDLGNSRMLEPVLRALGEHDQIRKEGADIADSLTRDLKAYRPKHHGIDPVQLTRDAIFEQLGVGDNGEPLETFLASREGQAALRRYHGLSQGSQERRGDR